MSKLRDIVSSVLLGPVIIHLIHFKRFDSNWYFTNATHDVLHNNIVYRSLKGLKIPEIVDEHIDKSDIDLQMSQLNNFKNDQAEDFAEIFINRIFIDSVLITIYELKNNILNTLYLGRVSKPQFDDNDWTLTLNCTTAESYLRRNIQTRKFQNACSNTIYDRYCGLNMDDWKVEVVITAISKSSIVFDVLPTDSGKVDEFDEPIMEVKTYDDGYFSSGFLSFGHINNQIVSHIGNTLNLYDDVSGLKIDDIINIYPGCEQSQEGRCSELFNNSHRAHVFLTVPNEAPVYINIMK